MKNKLMVTLAVGALMITTALPLTVQAGRGNGSGGGGQWQHNRSQSQQRLRDGSCTNPAGTQAGSRQKNGKVYGPGDGNGNGGVGPKDGTGYGGPNR
jgi:hypothetical protein